MSGALLDKSRVELKRGAYGTAPATALTDASLLPRVQEYRRSVSGRMVPMGHEDIRSRIPAAEYHVSRKVDGEFTVLVYRQGEVLSVNPGGTVRVGLPWQQEAADLLAAAGCREALVTGELYARRGEHQRPRVHDVVSVGRQPQSDQDLSDLQFAVFDLISYNGAAPPPAFAETWQLIRRLFGAGHRVHPVDCRIVKDPEGIARLYHEWVDEQQEEGIVVRSDLAGIFKIKPRHTLDVAIIGYTESTAERQGMLHDLLMAVMRPDGALHVLGRVGGGFTDDERREMLSDLKDMAVESEYAEVNSDHVAYQMVRPEWVVEISCLDLISQTTRGGAVNRMVLDFEQNGTSKYRIIRRLPLAAVISPQFVRRREEKVVRPEDIRIQQIASLVEVPQAELDARRMAVTRSELLRREVYTKQLKGQMMVRKFVMLQTNKAGDSEDYPAYVVHYTDFSPNRKDPLQREIRVSNSQGQIEKLWDNLKTANIKAGWQQHSVMATPGAEAGPSPTETSSQVSEGDQGATGKLTPSKRNRSPGKKKSG